MDSEAFAYILHLESDEKITRGLLFGNIWWTVIEGAYREEQRV